MSLAGGAQHSYTFQITLLAVTPPVWRLVAVPGRLTLTQLHEVIQFAMGWERKHPYRFDIAGKNYEAAPAADKPEEATDPAGVSLDDLSLSQGSTLTYIYDFKDDWVHHLTVQGVAPSTLRAPALLGGAGACPPEASGGPGRYAELLAALRAPDSAGAKAAKHHLGTRTDPTRWEPQSAAENLPTVGAVPTPTSQQTHPPGDRSKKNRRHRR
jgi:Plasmid pRiA4b ORF-3-like protein